MNAQKLKELMESAGVDSAEAERRAETFIADREAEEKLSKSLSVLEEVATIQRETENRQQERLEKAINRGQTDIAGVIAPALDDLLQEQRSQNDALAKGLTGVLELVHSLKEEMANLRDTRTQAPQRVAPLAKSVAFIPSPNDEPPRTASREDLFKALSAQASESPERAQELLSAVALLESGADPIDVATRFNLKG